MCVGTCMCVSERDRESELAYIDGSSNAWLSS